MVSTVTNDGEFLQNLPNKSNLQCKYNVDFGLLNRSIRGGRKKTKHEKVYSI